MRECPGDPAASGARNVGRGALLSLPDFGKASVGSHDIVVLMGKHQPIKSHPLRQSSSRPQSDWTRIVEALVEAMIRLDNALRPFVKRG
jgi:hypothetical protein